MAHNDEQYGSSASALDDWGLHTCEEKKHCPTSSGQVRAAHTTQKLKLKRKSGEACGGCMIVSCEHKRKAPYLLAAGDACQDGQQDADRERALLHQEYVFVQGKNTLSALRTEPREYYSTTMVRFTK
jgi:hypothetical protein